VKSRILESVRAASGDPHDRQRARLGRRAEHECDFVAQRLAPLAVGVRLIAVLPDVVDELADFSSC
jgi:hypothetical protein